MLKKRRSVCGIYTLCTKASCKGIPEREDKTVLSKVSPTPNDVVLQEVARISGPVAEISKASAVSTLIVTEDIINMCQQRNSAARARTLVCRPTPMPTESLLGYVLRLAELNGYESPSCVLTEAGIRYVTDLHSDDGIFRLARLVSKTNEQIASVATHQIGKRTYKTILLGNPVAKLHLVHVRMRVCPYCIQRCGFHEAHFDLFIMIACPLHRKPVLYQCPQCSSSIGWRRPGLLECRCGAQLSSPPSAHITPATYDLLDVVRRKILGLDLCQNYDSGIPASYLFSMTLQSLIRLVGALGRILAKQHGPVGWMEYARIVPAAAEALSDWPQGLHRGLEQMSKGMKGGISGSNWRRSINLLYVATYSAVGPSEGAFLRDAFNALGKNKPADQYRDLQSGHVICRGRHVSIGEFARLAGVSPGVVPRILRASAIPTVEVMRGGLKCTLINLQGHKVIRRAPGKIHGLEVAAKMIGIDTKLLRAFNRTGQFQINHLPPGMKGFHEADIKFFADKIHQLGLAKQKTAIAEEPVICLAQLLAGKIPFEHRFKVAKKILQGEIPVLGCKNDRFDGVLIASSAIPPFPWVATTVGLVGGVVSARGAASELNCGYMFPIFTLLQRGYITGVKKGRAWSVSEASLLRFKSKYVLLAAGAKKLGIHQGTLCRLCKQVGVQIIIVSNEKRRGPNVSIISIDDYLRLVGVLESEHTAKTCGLAQAA
jgi:hypothetical protein